METLRGTAGSYQLGELLGQGGFGETFLATRVEDGRRVALKRLRVERLREWKSLELFTREGQTLRSLSHPNIPAYLDDFSLGNPDAPEGFALVQEFIPGESLRDIMRAGRRLSAPEMLRWFSQLLGVLDYLHRLTPPVIHRDISPKNVMLRPDGQAFLIDFGAVQAALRSANAGASTAAGTFGYAPVEQFMGRAFPASDLYGLAMTFLAVCTGQEPETLPQVGIRVDVPRALEGLRVDARLALLLEQMTEPDVARRFSDAGGALARLQPLLSAVESPPASSPSNTNRETSPRTSPPREASGEALAPSPSEALTREANPARSVAATAWSTRAGLRLAAERLALFSAESAWPAPLLNDWEGLSASALSADGRWLLCATETERLLLSFPSLRVANRNKGTSAVAGLSPDGARMALFDHWNETLQRRNFDPEGRAGQGGKSFPDALKALDGVVRVLPSPDGALVALCDQSNKRVVLLDWEKGEPEGQLRAGCERDVFFTPDGQYLVCAGAEKLSLFHRDGGAARAEGASLALSLDGHTLALSRPEKGLERFLFVGPLGGLVPAPSFQGEPRRYSFSGQQRMSLGALRFSADGRWLVAGRCEARSQVLRELCVIELASGRTIEGFRLPGEKKLAGDIAWFGLSADGALLLASASVRVPRLGGDELRAVLVWSVEDARYLGAIAAREGRVVGLLSEGIFGALGEAPASFAGHALHRPEWVREALCGGTISLSPQERERWADLRARWEFADESAGRGSSRGERAKLVEAARGLTHLLPWALAEAQRSAPARPRFGAEGGGNDRLVSAMCVQLEQLSRRSPEEREALFQDFLAQQEGTSGAQEGAASPGEAARAELAEGARLDEERARLAQQRAEEESRAEAELARLRALQAAQEEAARQQQAEEAAQQRRRADAFFAEGVAKESEGARGEALEFFLRAQEAGHPDVAGELQRLANAWAEEAREKEAAEDGKWFFQSKDYRPVMGLWKLARKAGHEGAREEIERLRKKGR